MPELNRDLADAYLLRRQQAVDDEALDWLTRGAKEEKPAQPAPHQPAEEGGALDTAGAVAGDLGRGVIEAPRQILGGARDALQETLETVDAMGNWLNENVLDLSQAGEVDIGEGLPGVKAPASTTGGMIRNVSQFLTGFLGGKKVLGTLGAAKALGAWGTSMAAGAMADSVVFDEHQQRLSNLIESVPALKNPVTEYLAAAPDDSMAEGKLKNALEGLGLGVLTQGLSLGLKTMKQWRLARAASQADEAAPAARVTPPPDMKPLGDPGKPKMTVQAVPDDQAAAWLKVPGSGEGKAININLARLDTGEDIKEAIEKTAKVFTREIDEARRGVQTNEATAQLADAMGMTVSDLLKRQRGQAFNAEQALAARRILVSSADNLKALAAKVSSGSATEVEQVAFRKALSVHQAIQQQVSGLTAEAGRALQQFKMMASGPEGQVRAIREMLDRSGGTEGTQELAKMITLLETPEQIGAFVRQAEKATSKDMLFEAWINGLLSGPQTHAVNVTSNTLYSLWQVPERLLAGKIRELTGGEGVVSDEWLAQTYGLVKGMRDGLELAWNAIKSGEPADPIAKIEVAKHRALTGANLELSGTAGRAVDVLGEAIRLPGRFLTAEDEWFKAVGYRMELNAQAWRQAVQEGLEGRALASRVREIINNPPEHIQLAAVDASRYQTFTKPLGEAGQAFTKFANKIPAGRLVFPFIRTPANIIKGVGERTPFAFLSKSIRADIMAGGARRDLALAKISLGSMVMAVSADLAMSGQVTGGGPTDPGLRAALRRTGWQPYSVKIGDTYYAYSRIDPVGSLLGVAADMSEIMGQLEGGDADEIAAASVMAISNNVVNKTFLEGLSQTIALFSQASPELGAAKGSAYLKNLAGTVVPTFLATVERTQDPTLRDTRADPEDGMPLLRQMLNQIKSRVPGYSEDLPPVRNLWGDPVLLGGGLGPDLISPIYTSTEVSSPVDEEILANRVSIRMPYRQIDGVELSPKEYSRYVELAGNAAKDDTGRGLKETLEDVIQSPEYRDATDGPEGGKALVLKEHVRAFRAMAKARMYEEFPYLVDKREALRAEKVAAQGE